MNKRKRNEIITLAVFFITFLSVIAILIISLMNMKEEKDVYLIIMKDRSIEEITTSDSVEVSDDGCIKYDGDNVICNVLKVIPRGKDNGGLISPPERSEDEFQ